MALPVNGSTHLIPALLLIYRPSKDERLSWPNWLTCSGWFTHISGHPSAAGRAQDRESSPVRHRCSTTVLRHQPKKLYDNYKLVFFADNVEGALLLSQFLVTILLSQFFADNYKSIFADNIKGAVVEKLLS